MMNTHHQRLPAQCRIDDMKGPKRPRRIEWRRGQIGHKALQFNLAGCTGQDGMVQMLIEIEFRIIYPAITRVVLLNNLFEAIVSQQTLFNTAPQAVWVERASKQHHPDNLHQVVRLVHAQPGGINVRHRFASGH